MQKKLLYSILIISILIVIGTGLLLSRFLFISEDLPKDFSENDKFRNSVIGFVREMADNYYTDQSAQHPIELGIQGDWKIETTIYYNGEIKGKGEEENEILFLALEGATQRAFNDEKFKSLTKEDIKNVRFLINFKNREFSFIEYNKEGKELTYDSVIIRNLDKDLILQKIEQGKEFLFSTEKKDEHGFYKKYDVLNDDWGDRLHTVYSASIIYTFLYIYDFDKDESILGYISDWGDYLLSMQNKDQGDKRYGAFHYSYYFGNKEKELKFVVGTSALSIFTLLRLYDLTADDKYLESAKLAGDWLTTMQNPNGTMKPYVRYSDGKWLYGKKESLLYEGQVLSSLSKLYNITGDKKYYDAAEGIAKRFTNKYEEAGRNYVQGEYRSKNPISNSWVVMSLMDFYKTNRDDYYKDIVFELSSIVLGRQQKDSDDLLNYGRWDGAYSTSGIGWISEVMTDTYRFCKEQNRGDCDKYKEAVVRGIRWLIQNTYSEENTFFLENPERIIGGLFWNRSNKYIRTDSVCHALNGYTRIINDLEEGLLLSIPEKPLQEILDNNQEQ